MRTAIRVITLLVGLGALPATASAATWSTQLTSGSAVMGEVSRLGITVNNLSTTAKITTVNLQISSTLYDIDGGDAPVGWTVASIDRQNRAITFNYTGGACSTGGLAAGASMVLGLRVIGVEAASDASAETFITNGNKTFVNFGCSGTADTSATTHAVWKRVGLGAQLSVSPRSLSSGNVTVSLTVRNRSNNTTAWTVTPNANLSVSSSNANGAVLSKVSGPSPTSASIAMGASQTFTWVYTTTGLYGFARFTTAAVSATSNAAKGLSVSGPQVTSLDVDIGEFPALCQINPTTVVNNGTVTLTMIVSNNSTDPYSNTTALTPVINVVGQANLTIASGPSPASVTAMPPGASTSFVWVYNVSSTSIGSQFSFVCQAQTTRNGGNFQTDPVGSATGTIASYTLTTNPHAVSGGTGKAFQYTVRNGDSTRKIKALTLLDPDSNYFSGATFGALPSGWTSNTQGGTNNWAANTGSEIGPGQSQTFLMSFTVATVTANQLTSHRMKATLDDNTTVRVESQVTVIDGTRRAIEATQPVAVSSSNKNTLIWSNPSDHDGTLILRKASAFTSGDPQPIPGESYVAGALMDLSTTITVVHFSEYGNFSTSYADSTVTNGAIYYYRVYSHDGVNAYSAGLVPSTTGLISVPSAGGTSAPIWCYSMGFPSMIQPVTELGSGIFTSGNSSFVTASLTRVSDASLDGSERWRPTTVVGNVQSRFPVSPFITDDGVTETTDKYIVTGTFSGYGYAFNATNGVRKWYAMGGAQLAGTSSNVLAQPALQLYKYSNSTFQSANTVASTRRDIAFFPANTGGGDQTSNRVVAVSTRDGGQIRTYQPGDMDIISGGMAVDYTNNRLYVPSKSKGGAQPNLHVFDTVSTTTPVASLKLGTGVKDIDQAVIYDFASKQMYLVDNSCNAFGVDTLNPAGGAVWTYSLGCSATQSPSSWLWPLGNGFIASVKNSSGSGFLQRYAVSGTTVTPVWTSATSINGPSGITVDYTTQKIFVGSADGKIHRLDLATGADDWQMAIVTSGSLNVGAPTIDKTSRRMHVGTLDGRVCAVSLP